MGVGAVQHVLDGVCEEPLRVLAALERLPVLLAAGTPDGVISLRPVLKCSRDYCSHHHRSPFAAGDCGFRPASMIQRLTVGAFVSSALAMVTTASPRRARRIALSFLLR